MKTKKRLEDLLCKSFIISILAILSVAFSSGCISQKDVSASGNDGLVIKNIYTDPPSDKITTTDQKMNIYFEIDNIGSAKATNIAVELIGTNWLTPQELSQADSQGNTMIKRKFNELNPPDPTTGSPGSMKAITFSIPVPKNIPEGQVVSYPLRIRATYTYGSSGVAIINGYSQQRYLREVEQGKMTKILPTAINVQQSALNTPIQISLLGPDKLVVPSNPPSAYEEYTYHITFSNIGNGVPITNNKDGTVLGGAWITGPGASLKDCLDSESTSLTITAAYSALTTQPSYWQKYIDVKLQTGTRSVTRPCTIMINNAVGPGATNTWNNRESDSISLNFDLIYSYYLEKDFSITVTSPIIKTR